MRLLAITALINVAAGFFVKEFCDAMIYEPTSLRDISLHSDTGTSDLIRYRITTPAVAFNGKIPMIRITLHYTDPLDFDINYFKVARIISTEYRYMEENTRMPLPHESWLVKFRLQMDPGVIKRLLQSGEASGVKFFYTMAVDGCREAQMKSTQLQVVHPV